MDKVTAKKCTYTTLSHQIDDIVYAAFLLLTSVSVQATIQKPTEQCISNRVLTSYCSYIV